MGDLVERLRSADMNSQQRVLGSRIFGEAADEITRLRAAHTKVGKFRIDGFESRYDLVPLQKEPDHE